MQPPNDRSAGDQDSSPEQTAQALLNLRCAVDHCHDAIIITDPAGRIEFVNLAFESLTGLSVQDSVGKNFASLAEAQTSASDSVLDTVLQRGIHHKATELRRKDGSTLPLECAIVAVRDRDGSVANLVYAGRDLTQERALQPELAQARNLQTVATLAGGAAHDFNNLLMVISAYAELALHTLYNEHPLRRNLQEILEAARRATDLTRQLLVFGRKQVQGLQPVELNSIIKDASQMLSKVLGEDIELQLSLQKDLGPVEADPGQLDQVLLNLTVNARDAMPDGGKLVIQTQTVSSDDPDIGKLPTSMREFILLSVTDSGVGIPAEQLLRIFDPFFTTKAEGKGTGLGLATVDSIIRQSHGFIRVDSELNRGTRFRIWLPRASRSQTGTHSIPCSEPDAVGGSETVLVVEDDDGVRETTAEFLSSIGYRVLSAGNGPEALHSLETHLNEIDLMITDVVMPAMNRTKLARLASAKRPELKILFMSGHALSALLRKGMKDLSANFLAKPFSLKLLAAKLKDALHEPVRARAAAAGAG